MFRKTKYLFMLCIFLVTACVTGGLSIWVFTNSSATASTTTGSGNSGENTLNDGIKENYSFGQTEVGNEYVYFFFPSTLYLEFYSKGYSNPENIFGYNEVRLNDVGDPKLDLNGNALYNVVTSATFTNPTKNINKVYLYRETATNYRWNNNFALISYGFYSEADFTKLYGGWDKQIHGYLTNYENYNKSPSNGATRFAIKSESMPVNISSEDTYYSYLTDNLNNNEEYYRYNANSAGGVYYQKDPYSINNDSNGYANQNRDEEILSPRKGTNFGLNLALPNYYYPVSNGDNTLNDIRLMEARKYRNDRFGARASFYDLDDPNNKANENTGIASVDGEGSRYLPIKLTVNGALNPDIYKVVIPQLVCATYDDHLYFDFTSNVWTYVNKNSAGDSSEYRSALGGFTAKDLANVYDIMQNPSLYSTSEDIDGDGMKENVIRLYPVYSNGKNAGAELTEGGRDALRAQIKYNSTYSTNNQNTVLPNTYKLTYSSESSTLKGNSLNYGVLKNINLEYNKYDKITFEIDIANGVHNWIGNWVTAYTIDSIFINDLIDDYGEGLYSFYLAVGNSASNSGSDHGYIWSDESLLSALTKHSETFPSLYLKNLMYLNPHREISDTDIDRVVIGYDPFNAYMSGITRPICLLVEKVTSLRVVKDIPFPELTQDSSSTSGDETSSTTSNDFESQEFVWSDIDSTISDIYSSGDILVNSSDIYAITKDQFEDGEDAFNPGTSADISDSNPYIYVIQNADFRNVDSLFFQIRFGSQYINNAMELNVGGTTGGYYAFKYGSINTTKESGTTTSKDAYRFFESQSTMFNNSSSYFIQTATVTDANGVKRTGLKLKDATAKGVYDLLLIRDLNYTSDDTSSDTSSNTNKYKFDIYIYRHKIDFVKVFNGNPGTYKDKNELEFIAHNLSDDPKTQCIWENSFFLGDILSTGSVDSKTSGTPTTLKNAILNVCNIDNKVYGLYDAVTGDAIAYIKNDVIYGLNGNTSGNKDIDLFTLAKNYVLYIAEVKSTSTSS